MKNIFKSKFLQKETIFQSKGSQFDDRLLTVENMQKTILREKARSDRRDHDFSVIVIDIEKLNNGKDFEYLVNFLGSRLRLIDEIGWYDENQVGIILPYTSSENAVQVAEDLMKISKNDRPIKLAKILSYPSMWPFNNRQL